MKDRRATKKRTSGAGQSRPLLWLIVAQVAVVLVAAAAYANSLDVPFYFDDEQNIVDKTEVHMTEFTPETLSDAFAFKPTPRPVAYMSFALNHLISGLDVRGMHAGNILIHAIAGILVFQLGLVFIRRLRPDDEAWVAILFAFTAAAFFVAHPIQSQAVTFLVQRMTSLCAMFYLAAVLAYVRGRLTDREWLRWSLWTTIPVFWLLALGSKQFAVTLPAAILLVEWLLWQRDNPTWWKKAAIFGVAGMALMVGIAFVFKGEKLLPLITQRYDLRDFTLAERLMTQPRVIAHYMSLVVWPWPSRFTLLYDFRVSTGLFSPWTTIPMILAVLGSGLAGLALVRKVPVLAFALLWVLVHLAVESSIIPLEMVYEHRMYLPMLGVCFLAAWAVIRLLKTPVPAVLAVVVLTAALSASTITRNQDWLDPERFWLQNVANAPGAARAHYNLGKHYFESEQVDLALEQAELSFEADPYMQLAYLRAGNVHEIQGRLQRAEELYTAGIDVPAEKVNKRQDVTSTLYISRGQLRSKLGRFEDAIADLDVGIELSDANEDAPVHFIALSARALANMNLGRDAEAVPDLERAVAAQPKYSESQNNLAWILAASPDASLHDGPRAVEHARVACQLTGFTNPATLSTLAASQARAGNFQAAIETQRLALRYAGGSAQARYTARLRLYEAGQPFTTPARGQ